MKLSICFDGDHKLGHVQYLTIKTAARMQQDAYYSIKYYLILNSQITITVSLYQLQIIISLQFKQDYFSLALLL